MRSGCFGIRLRAASRPLAGDKAAPTDVLGARKGEFVGLMLADQRLSWNQVWEGEAVLLPSEGLPAGAPSAGGGRVTVLGPTCERLLTLHEQWRDVAEDASLHPGGATRGLVLRTPNGVRPRAATLRGRRH